MTATTAASITGLHNLGGDRQVGGRPRESAGARLGFDGAVRGRLQENEVGKGSATGTRGSPPKNWRGNTRCGAKPGSRPALTPRAYYKQRVTGQAPCYAVKRTVSPVRALSPVRNRVAPRECGHPARAYGACSACLVAGTQFWASVSCAISACCVSRALGGCSASYACAPLVPGKCGSGA